MSRLNRVYQNSQVEFSLCSCLKQMVKGQNNISKSSNMEAPDKDFISQPLICRQNSRNKAGRLKLSKNLASDSDLIMIKIKQSKTNEHNKISAEPYLTNNSYTLSMIKIIQPMSYEQMIKQSELKVSLPSTFRQSNKQLMHYNQNEIKDIHNLQEIYKKSARQQCPLFSSINARMNFNQINSVPCSKYNSTSSTTLFETKNLLQQCLNKQKNIQPLQQQQNFIKGKEKGLPTGNRKIYSENIGNRGLNIVDFSRVREVQTVMSESFSFSYLDVASEVHGSSSSLISKQFQNKQMQSQMKRLLFN